MASAEADFKFTEAQSKTEKALATQGSIPQQHAEEAEFTLKAKREALASARFAVRVAHHEVQLAQAALQHMGGGREAATSNCCCAPPLEIGNPNTPRPAKGLFSDVFPWGGGGGTTGECHTGLGRAAKGVPPARTLR